MGAFRAAAASLDRMAAGALATAAAHAASLPDQLYVIDALARTATREGLRCGGWMAPRVHGPDSLRLLPPHPPPAPVPQLCWLHRKAVEVRTTAWHEQLLVELAGVKRAFEGIKGELPPGAAEALPPAAGRIVLLRGLLAGIERTWEAWVGMAPTLPAVAKAAEAAAAYEALHAGLQQAINAINTQVRPDSARPPPSCCLAVMGCATQLPLPLCAQWFGSVPQDLDAHLQHNLLRQDRAAGGLLQLRVNLSPALEAALEEAALFERLRMGVPAVAHDLLQGRARLLGLRVAAEQVAHAYNAVLGRLSADDRRLCRDRIRWACL